MSPNKGRVAKDRDRDNSRGPASLHGGPRGLLLYYILHRVATRPCHGYEILQGIENRTGGAWRPGAGSVYPILKKLLSEGLIKTNPASRGDSRRIYEITPEGASHLKQTKEMFASFGQRMSAMRGLLIDLIDPEYVEDFMVDGSKKQFELAQEIFKSKADELSRTDVEFILKEYSLGLERQLAWANQLLGELKTAHRTARQ